MILFDELTTEENGEIQSAREAGFCAFYPAFPNAKAQAVNTLAAARAYMGSSSTTGHSK